MTKKYLSFDEVLDSKDVEYREVKAFGGVIRIGSLSAAEMLDHNQRVEDKVRNAGLILIVASIVDEEGKRIGDLKKLERLTQKNSKEIGKVVAEILDLNAMTRESQKRLEDEAKKDSGVAVPDGSRTASPSN
jgi:hypothetical protein